MTEPQQDESAARIPEIVVLYCRRSVRPEGTVHDMVQTAGNYRVRVSPIACTSKVEPLFLLRVLASGTEAIEVVGCPEDQCRLAVGSQKAKRRVMWVRRLLEEAGLDVERVGMSHGVGLTEGDLLARAERRFRREANAETSASPPVPSVPGRSPKLP